MNANKLVAVIAGVSYEVDMDALSSEMIFGLARKGFQETLTDGTASLKLPDEKTKDLPTDKDGKPILTPALQEELVNLRNEARNKRMAELTAGTYSFGGGSKGMTAHDKAVREILIDNGFTGWKKLSDQTVESALEAFTKALAEKQGAEWEEGYIAAMLEQIENADGFDAVVAKFEPKAKTKIGLDVTLAS